MPQKSWAVGEEVLAADFNTYLQNQVVPQFPDTATLNTQWPAPPNGAVCVTIDTQSFWQRVGGTWWRPFARIAGSMITTAITLNVGNTTVSTISALSIPSTRRLLLRGHVNVTGTPGVLFMQGWMDSAAIAGTMRMAQWNALPGGGGIMEGSITFAPAAGSHSFQLVMNASTTGGSVAGNQDNGYFDLWDAGPAS